MRILKAILLAPVRIIVFAIQLVLTVGVVIFGAAGGVITKAGEIVGGLLILVLHTLTLISRSACAIYFCQPSESIVLQSVIRERGKKNEKQFSVNYSAYSNINTGL